MPPTSALGVPCGDSGRSDRENSSLGWGVRQGLCGIEKSWVLALPMSLNICVTSEVTPSLPCLTFLCLENKDKKTCFACLKDSVIKCN